MTGLNNKSDSDAGRTGQPKLRADIEKILSPAIDCRAPYAKVMIDAIVASAALPEGAEPPQEYPLPWSSDHQRNAIVAANGLIAVDYSEPEDQRSGYELLMDFIVSCANRAERSPLPSAAKYPDGWLFYECHCKHTQLCQKAPKFCSECGLKFSDLESALPSPGAQPPSELDAFMVERIAKKICQYYGINSEQTETIMGFITEELVPLLVRRTSAVAPGTSCGQHDRDSQLLAMVENPGIIYYGPYTCEVCEAAKNRPLRMICKVSAEQGGMEFDYPEGIIYPNTNWVRHMHTFSERAVAPAEVPREKEGQHGD